jgi:hypothetical protein
VVGKLGTMLVHANASTGPRTKAGAGDRTCACASFPCMGDVPQGSYLNSVAPPSISRVLDSQQPSTANRQPPTATGNASDRAITAVTRSHLECEQDVRVCLLVFLARSGGRQACCPPRKLSVVAHNNGTDGRQSMNGMLGVGAASAEQR